MAIDAVTSFMKSVEYDQIPHDVVEMVKKSILDFIGVSYAGYQNKSASIALNSSDWFGGEGTCTIIGQERQVTPMAATFMNAILASSLDMDDGHRGAVGHPSCMVIPPVLAAGELKGNLTGKDLITAILVGYEVGIRCGVVMNSNHQHLFYGSGGWGIFGSAAGTAKLLGLKDDALKNALTIGEVFGPTAQCGKSIDAGAMTKESAGWGATTGIFSVLLAESEFTGPNDILLDEQFYGKHAKATLASLGTIYEIRNIYYKQYPSCKWSHSPITAALAIKEKYNPSIDEISEVTIETFSKALTLNHTAPQSTEAAQYSIPYTVATAFCYGALEPRHIQEDYIFNEKILGLAKKIRLTLADDLEALFPEKRPARVIVKLNSGEVLTEEVQLIKGDPENPLSWDELVNKFHSCTRDFLSYAKRIEVIEQIMELEEIKDVHTFTKLFRPI